MNGWGPGMMMGRRFNEERLNALKDELAITEVQKSYGMTMLLPSRMLSRRCVAFT